MALKALACSPHVLHLYDVYATKNNTYIITELCNGGDLETALRKKGIFNEAQARPIINDIMQGLLELANKRVIHRDLKVANVFLHNKRAKIADFGFAKITRYNPH